MVLFFPSCAGGRNDPPFYDYKYNLSINFKDTDDIDLVMPLGEEYYKSENSSAWKNEVNPEEYFLDIIIDNPNEKSVRREIAVSVSQYDEQYNRKGTNKYGKYEGDGTWYLENYFTEVLLLSKDIPYYALTYRIQCPSIFGDESFHEIKTWWQKGLRSGHEQYLTCIRATFDGNEYIPIKVISYNLKGKPYYTSFFLDIILDK